MANLMAFFHNNSDWIILTGLTGIVLLIVWSAERSDAKPTFPLCRACYEERFRFLQAVITETLAQNRQLSEILVKQLQDARPQGNKASGSSCGHQKGKKAA